MASGGHGRAAASADADEYLRAVRHLGADDESRVDMDAALSEFWQEETEKGNAALTSGEFKASNDLPLARIKRIMKSDEDVRMIAAEAPVLFAKACELFITELTIRSYCYADGAGGGSSKRRTLTREDVCTAVQKTDIFDFLVGVLTPGGKPQYQLDLEAGILPSGSSSSAQEGAGGSAHGHAQPYGTVPFASGPRPMPGDVQMSSSAPTAAAGRSGAGAGGASGGRSSGRAGRGER